ncbi:N-acetylmannosaminyltransferase [hydrothermal vent metagenome]|uniref:N-acetylmannosaminyltransferase n=1 Tax=hydrothermal vent metagenome TaxID=652676 RepID=A0A3B1CRD0_9ZZZZ
MASEDTKRFNVLGVGISSIDMGAALKVIDGWITRRESKYVTITGVHGVMESQGDEDIRKIHNQAGMVTPDGMPLVWLGRFNKHKNVNRVYGPDLMLEIFAQSAAKGYRHYLYGGNEGVPELLKSKLDEKFPGINIVGTYSPPFRALSEEEDKKIVQMLNVAKPDIIWVGLSTPKQEKWMAGHVDRLNVPALIGVGAAFDFHSGLIKQAPPWMQKSGLEWLFRLLTEPRRLWRRYFRNNPRFVFLIVRQMLGLKRYADDW